MCLQTGAPSSLHWIRRLRRGFRERALPSPPTHYAHSGDASIAYHVYGSGSLDLGVINGPASHLELMWEESATARSFERLGTFARVVMFDRRGTGLSDAVTRPPTL